MATNKDQPKKKSQKHDVKVKWRLLLSGGFKTIDKVLLETISGELRQLTKDRNLTLSTIEFDARKLIIESTMRGFENLKSMFKHNIVLVCKKRVLGLELDNILSVNQVTQGIGQDFPDRLYVHKILIADDHAVVRRGLRQIICDELDFEVVAEAKNGQEVLDLVEDVAIDIVLLDITMPDKNGLVVLQELRLSRPKLPVLIQSMHPEDQFALRALKLGAAGYLTKEAAPEELIGAIRKVISGGKFISSGLAEQLLAEIGSDSPRPAPERLTEREFQVLRKIAQGKTIGQIAEEMNLSVKTISSYRARLLLKMKMKTNAELTRYSVQHGLVDFGE